VTAELVRADHDSLPIPVGCRPRQVKLAKALLERDVDSDESLAQLLKDAGYSQSVAFATARRTVESAGVQRAISILKARQLDSARSVVGIGVELIDSADKDELSSRDKYFLGFKALEVGTAMGENTETGGSSDRWKVRVARACRLMARLTAATLLSPPDVQLLAEQRHQLRMRQRGY
jgi:hypothetical protein